MPALDISRVEVHIFRREAGRPLFLLLRGATGHAHAGKWAALTGTVTANETAVTAARRLVAMSTGLDPIGMWALDHLHTQYDHAHDAICLIPVLAVEVDARTTTLSPEYDDARWITPDQALDLLRMPGHRDALRRIQDDIITATDRGTPFRVPLEK